MRDLLRRQPGVKLIEAFDGPEGLYAVHVYENESAYTQVVDHPNSYFNKMADEHGIHDVAEWVSSVKGTTKD